MTPLQQKIYDYIQMRQSTDKICSDLNITKKQLHHYLLLMRNKGIVINNIFGSNGIIYLDNIPVEEKNAIKVRCTNPDVLKTIVLADLHVGHLNETFDCINYVFEYADANDIHIIVMCGDILEGQFTSYAEDMCGLREAERFIKEYPYDKKINTIGIAGNHEKDGILYKAGIDVTTLINNSRSDIFLSGYQSADVCVENSIIHLDHLAKEPYKNTWDVLIKGHKHMFKVSNLGLQNIIITAPAFSKYSATGMYYPEFLEVDYYFHTDKTIKQVNVKHLAILDRRKSMPQSLGAITLQSTRTRKKEESKN